MQWQIKKCPASLDTSGEMTVYFWVGYIETYFRKSSFRRFREHIVQKWRKAEQ